MVKFYKSKTMIFSILLAIFGALQVYVPTMQNIIPKEMYGVVITGIGVVVAVLRVVTTKPLGEK